ncbi:MAG: zinc-binding dehydrogenase [Solirubrobacterales bacterium]|nr:zinc-binding dehydrogenase [Solirubrobacterales bacterium]
MSTAIAFFEPGPPEVLRAVEVDPPEPGAGEVRVRVRAAGVQPADAAARAKAFAPPGVELSFPQVIGNELAGVVDLLGDGVNELAVGDEVIGFRTFGAYAELVTIGAEQVVAKPPGMPWEEAGALSASGQTAHTALEDLGLGAGEKLLVHAAAGGVGTMAVQLARARGATVIGTASERNHDHLRSLGATGVAYGEGLVERVRSLAPRGVDAVLDAIGGEALDASVELVADRDRIGTVVGFDRVAELGIRPIRTRRSAARLAELCDLYEAGGLRVHVSRTFPLRAAADAHREVEKGHVRGKLALIVDEPVTAEPSGRGGER